MHCNGVFWPFPLAADEDAQTVERNPALRPSVWAAQVYEELLQKQHTYSRYYMHTDLPNSTYNVFESAGVFKCFLELPNDLLFFANSTVLWEIESSKNVNVCDYLYCIKVHAMP